MLGMACGDALGAQVEFQARGSFPWQTDMTGGGPHRLESGQWTDDTAMALALAEWLIDGRSNEELMNSWVRWMTKGWYSCTGTCFDVGTQTQAALRHWARTGALLPATAKGRVFAEGNGAVMRVPPVALRHLGRRNAQMAVAKSQARLTHGPVAARCAAALTAALDCLLTGGAREAAVDVALAQAGVVDPRGLSILGIRSGGAAKDTLGASLWCLTRADSAERAIEMAVNLGDDSDTTGAVTGALAGAHWGASALPERWLGTVAWRSRLEDTADRLLAASAREQGDEA